MVLPRIKTEWSLAYRYAMQLTKDTALTSISLASHWHITSVSLVYHCTISLHGIPLAPHWHITSLSLLYHSCVAGISLASQWCITSLSILASQCYTSLRTSDRRGIDESMTRLPLVCHWYITRDIPLTKEIYLS